MAEENIVKVFQSFINDIVKVFPEYEGRLNTYYKDVIDENNPNHEKLKDFLNNIDEISDKISEKDITLFDSDPILLQNVSFKTIWMSDISDQTRVDIWKYLQSFCILKINMESKEKMDDVIKKIESKEKIKDKKTLNDMKKLKKLNESINVEEIQKIIKEDPDTLSNGINEMESMFENTGIGKIAKEITDELDIEGMIQGDGGIENLFSGGNMMNIIQSISGKMDPSMNPSGSNNLMEEATNICSSMQGNPLFSSLFNNMTGSMVPEESAPSQEVKNIDVSDPNHNPNKTRERLQKKLEEKKKNINVEKKD